MISLFKKKDKNNYSLSDKLIIKYETDIKDSIWNMKVYVNNVYVGYIERGDTCGFWFKNKLGEDFFELELYDLQYTISYIFDNYRLFFKKITK